MSSAPAAAAGGAPAAAGGDLAKGGKPKVQHDKARGEFLALMAERLEEIRHSRDEWREDQRYVGAQVILSIEGLGYQTRDGTFSEKKPGKTTGKSATHYDERSFLQQFYITVGMGPGFARTRLVCVSDPRFFRAGEGPGSKKPKILGGHDPVLKVGDFVFTRQAEGAATHSVAAGVGRWSAIEQSTVSYSDLYAVLPKADAREWISSGFLRMV